MFRHFVVKHYDFELEKEFQDIAKKLFTSPYLVMKEYRPSEHYHFQGITEHSLDRFKEMTQELITQKHRYRKEVPDCRLCVHSGKLVDQTGFQYMVKQSNSLVMATTFTDDEISGLAVKSDEYVKKLKNELNEYVHPLIKEKLKMAFTKEAMKEVIAFTRLQIGEFLFKNGKMIRTSQMKDKAVNCILYHPRTKLQQRNLLYSI